MNEPRFFSNLKTLKPGTRGNKHHTLLTLLPFFVSFNKTLFALRCPAFIGISRGSWPSPNR